MTSILRLLYEREIIPPEAEVPHTEKYRSLMREAGERPTAPPPPPPGPARGPRGPALRRRPPVGGGGDPGLAEQLESYLNVRGQAEREERALLFVRAFQLGAQLMLEILDPHAEK